MEQLIRELSKIRDRSTNNTTAANDGDWDQIPLKALLLDPGGSNSSVSTNTFGSKLTRPYSEIVVLFVAYSVIILLSLFGNSLVCYVVTKNKRLHTVTNIFIANLAMSDITITVLNIPFSLARLVLKEWMFGSFMCHFVNFILMVSIYVSTFTMAAIAVDRHLVILYPLRPRLSLPMGFIIIVITWFVGTLLSLPFAIFSQVADVDFLLVTVKRCRLEYPEPSEAFEKYITLCTVIAQYCLPMTIIAYAYWQIGWTLWSRQVVGQPTENQQNSHAKVKKKTIKMLVVVVMVFCVCWLPLNLYHLLTDFHPDAKQFAYNSAAYLVCHWLAMCSVCCNPFIYCWLNETFRAEFRAKFSWFTSRRPKIYPGIEFDGVLLRNDMLHHHHEHGPDGSRCSYSNSRSSTRHSNHNNHSRTQSNKAEGRNSALSPSRTAAPRRRRMPPSNCSVRARATRARLQSHR